LNGVEASALLIQLYPPEVSVLAGHSSLPWLQSEVQPVFVVVGGQELLLEPEEGLLIVHVLPGQPVQERFAVFLLRVFARHRRPRLLALDHDFYPWLAPSS